MFDPSNDELEIRNLYQKLLDSWAVGDGKEYAVHFSEEADYIVANGIHEHGRTEISAAHQQLFDTWAKHSQLIGEIKYIRFFSPEIAYLIANGAILMPDQSLPDEEDWTIYSLVAQKTGAVWQFVAYQNTPIQAQATE